MILRQNQARIWMMCNNNNNKINHNNNNHNNHNHNNHNNNNHSHP